MYGQSGQYQHDNPKKLSQTPGETLEHQRSHMAVFGVAYLTVGVFTMLWNLASMIRTYETVQHPDGSTTQRRAIVNTPAWATILIMLFLLVGWLPAVIARYLYRGGNDDDPQSHVPPRYR